MSFFCIFVETKYMSNIVIKENIEIELKQEIIKFMQKHELFVGDKLVPEVLRNLATYFEFGK